MKNEFLASIQQILELQRPLVSSFVLPMTNLSELSCCFELVEQLLKSKKVLSQPKSSQTFSVLFSHINI